MGQTEKTCLEKYLFKLFEKKAFEKSTFNEKRTFLIVYFQKKNYYILKVYLKKYEKSGKCFLSLENAI